jgi:hypothetical protein
MPTSLSFQKSTYYILNMIPLPLGRPDNTHIFAHQHQGNKARAIGCKGYLGNWSSMGNSKKEYSSI